MPISPLFIQKNTYKKGSQYSLCRLIGEFQKDNQCPVLLSSREGWLTESSRRLGVHSIVKRFPGSRSITARLWRNSRFARSVKSYLDDNNIKVDIVIGNDHSEGLITLKIAEKLGVPKILILRHPYMSEKGLTKYGGYNMDALVSINRWMETKVSKWNIDGPEKIFIENGLSDEEFYSPLKIPDFFPGEILVPGSSEPRKGWEDMFKALILIEKRQKDFPAVTFDFTGERPDFYSSYERPLKNSRFTVRFIGHHDDFQKLMRSYNLIFEPTRAETFGMVGLEAIAAGVPIISTQAGNISKILDEQFLINTKKPEDIARKLVYIRKNWSRINYPINTYQKSLKEKYSIKRTYQGYKNLVEKMIDK